MAKKDYYAVFVITDSAMRRVKNDDAKKEIVKLSALPQGRFPDGFTAFCWASFVDGQDYEDRICESIKGDDKEVVITGLKSLGMISIPYEETFAIGDDYTAPDIVEFEKPNKQGYATITDLIYSKTKEDVTALLNWGKQMETLVGGPIKMAETEMSTMKAEEETEFFGAEYEQHMMNLYHSLYRSEREYEANV